MKAKSLWLAPLILIASLPLASELILAWLYPPYGYSPDAKMQQLGVGGTTLLLSPEKWITYQTVVYSNEKLVIELINYVGKAMVCVRDETTRECSDSGSAPLKFEYTFSDPGVKYVDIKADSDTRAVLRWDKQTCLFYVLCSSTNEGKDSENPIIIASGGTEGGIEATFVGSENRHYYSYTTDRHPLWNSPFSFIASITGSEGTDFDIEVYDFSGKLIARSNSRSYPDYVYVNPSSRTNRISVVRVTSHGLNEYNLQVSRPRILGYQLSTTTVKPGQKFTIRYRVLNPFRHNIDVWLGASTLVKFESREIRYDSPEYDVKVTLAPGENWVQRDFVMPKDAFLGQHQLQIALWGMKNENLMDMLFDWKAYDAALTVTTPLNPEITHLTASPSTLPPGGTTTVTVKWIFYYKCIDGCMVKANAFGSWAKTEQLAVIYDGRDGNYGVEQNRSFTVRLPANIPAGVHYVRVGFCYSDTAATSFDELAKCTYRDIPITVQVPRYSFRVVVRGGDNRIYHRVCTDAACESWSAIAASAADTPGVVLLSNQLYLVIRGPDDGILFGVLDLQTGSFSGWERIGGSTPSRPALATDGSKLYLVVRGRDNRIYLRVYTISTRTWSSWTVLPGSTIDAPAAAVHGGRLHIVVRGGDGMSIYHGQYDLSSGQWLGWAKITGSTPSAPTLVSDGTKLWLAVRGGDNRIYIRTWSGSWGSWSRIPTGSTDTTPAIKVVGATLVVVVKGNGSTSLYYCYYDSTANTWSSWIRMSGSTPSSPTVP